MIRFVLGSAFAVGGLGLALAFTGPDLVTGISGAPMIVKSEGQVSLDAARFEGDTCASTLLYGESPATGDGPAGMRLVAFGLRADGSLIELGMRDAPAADGAPLATVALLFDEDGKLVAISKPEALAPAAAHGACASAPTPSGAPI